MERRVPFEKAVNFRDMGGYKAADGRTVKWKKLYRCGHMAQLTDNDLARFTALGTAAICDFRSNQETEATPSRLTDQLHAVRHHLEIWPKAAGSIHDAAMGFAAGTLADTAYIDHQKNVYRAIVIDFADRYATMFRLMDEAEGKPIVIHCTAGKDRTGIGAALILHALDVPRDTIFADYMLTNECKQLGAYIHRLVEKGVAGQDAALSDDEKFARVLHLFGAKTELLETALAVMTERSGSIDGYIRDELGVSDAKREKLRQWFLE